MIIEGDRVIRLRAADGDVLVNALSAVKTGTRFVVGSTADGASIPIAISPTNTTGQRGFIARTADNVTVPVNFFSATFEWNYSDKGLYYGGQAGALREYSDIGDVSESPFSHPTAMSVRFDWENDAGHCSAKYIDGHGSNPTNPPSVGYFAAAIARITVTASTRLHFDMYGMSGSDAVTSQYKPHRCTADINDVAFPGDIHVVQFLHDREDGLSCTLAESLQLLPSPNEPTSFNLHPGSEYLLYFYPEMDGDDTDGHWRSSSNTATDGFYYRCDMRFGPFTGNIIY